LSVINYSSDALLLPAGTTFIEATLILQWLDQQESAPALHLR
jgi:hypothetical protein